MKKILAVWLCSSSLLFALGGGNATITPLRMTLTQTLTTTGVVTPRNRLEIRPPVAGRVEQMLVAEGQQVQKGDPLATLSSTDRATLIDAAQGQGAEELAYWEEVYKPIQLVSPMEATVIVATLQPGQVVASTDAIVVLSDQLIVRAQVDETDISSICEGQRAIVTLDAFPKAGVEAAVSHIYYESTVASNVTVYKVDLLPVDAPDFFRSGMNAQIAFETLSKEGALTLPLEAVELASDPATVTLLDEKGKPQVVGVQTGIITNDRVEILQGLSENSRVVSRSRQLNLNPESGGKNPFMPEFRGGKK